MKVGRIGRKELMPGENYSSKGNYRRKRSYQFFGWKGKKRNIFNSYTIESGKEEGSEGKGREHLL